MFASKVLIPASSTGGEQRRPNSSAECVRRYSVFCATVQVLGSAVVSTKNLACSGLAAKDRSARFVDISVLPCFRRSKPSSTVAVTPSVSRAATMSVIRVVGWSRTDASEKARRNALSWRRWHRWLWSLLSPPCWSAERRNLQTRGLEISLAGCEKRSLTISKRSL